jgi:DNA-binding CsgD family transcriptional regulator
MSAVPILRTFLPHRLALPLRIYTVRRANWAARGRPVCRRRGVFITERPDDPERRIVPRQLERPWSEMIPMHSHLISQLIADRQAGLMASARQQRLARQARAARRARPAQRGRAAPMLAALGRLARRRSSPRTIQTPAAGPGRAAPTLTPREPGLLKLVARGLTNPDIAQQLVLSEHTVHRHLANILRKLSVSSRVAAAACLRETAAPVG